MSWEKRPDEKPPAEEEHPPQGAFSIFHFLFVNSCFLGILKFAGPVTLVPGQRVKSAGGSWISAEIPRRLPRSFFCFHQDRPRYQTCAHNDILHQTQDASDTRRHLRV